MEGGEILDALGLHLEVAPSGPGKLMVNGYDGDGDRVERALSMLRRDIPDIKEIDNRVLTPRALAETLFRMLEQAGFEDSVDIGLYPDRIRVTGELSEQGMAIWKRVREAFHDKYGRVIRFEEDLTLRERGRTPDIVREPNRDFETWVEGGAKGTHVEAEGPGGAGGRREKGNKPGGSPDAAEAGPDRMPASLTEGSRIRPGSPVGKVRLLPAADRIEAWESGPVDDASGLIKGGGKPETPPAEPRVRIPIVGVTCGPTPHVSLAGGEKIFEGASLKGGYVLKTIRPDCLVLTRGTDTIYYYPGGD